MPLDHNVIPYLEAGKVADARDLRINHWPYAMDFPAHLHAQVELIYVRRGALEVLIDNQTHAMHAGDVAIAFPNCVHAYQPVDGAPADEDIWFFIFYPQLAGDYAANIDAFVPRSPFIDAAQLSEEVGVALERLTKQQQPFRPAVVKAYLQIIMDGVWELLRPIKETDCPRDLSYRALQYMTNHFREPLSLQSVAHDLGVSQTYLSSVFSKKLNMSFPRCLNILRVELARDMLRHTRQPITTILYECGYESSRSFNRAFMELCGVTPRDYRSQFQRIEHAYALLRDTDLPLADILRECGYDNPDTFCRVFTDLYGADPEKYRLSHFAHRS